MRAPIKAAAATPRRWHSDDPRRATLMATRNATPPRQLGQLLTLRPRAKDSAGEEGPERPLGRAGKQRTLAATASGLRRHFDGGRLAAPPGRPFGARRVRAPVAAAVRCCGLNRRPARCSSQSASTRRSVVRSSPASSSSTASRERSFAGPISTGWPSSPITWSGPTRRNSMSDSYTVADPLPWLAATSAPDRHGPAMTTTSRLALAALAATATIAAGCGGDDHSNAKTGAAASGKLHSGPPTAPADLPGHYTTTLHRGAPDEPAATADRRLIEMEAHDREARGHRQQARLDDRQRGARRPRVLELFRGGNHRAPAAEGVRRARRQEVLRQQVPLHALQATRCALRRSPTAARTRWPKRSLPAARGDDLHNRFTKQDAPCSRAFRAGDGQPQRQQSQRQGLPRSALAWRLRWSVGHDHACSLGPQRKGLSGNRLGRAG
jgi:hypothetical protein